MDDANNGGAGAATAPVDGPLSDEDILNELNKLKDVGLISYVVPTDPLGESWVVGLDGQILKLTSGEAIAFLAGAHAVVRRVATQRGLL